MTAASETISQETILLNKKLAKKKYDAARYHLIRDKKIASARKYYLENRDHCLAYSCEWGKKNRPKNNLASRKWRAANREFKAEINKRWKANNPDKQRAINHRKRARKQTTSTPEQIKSADAKIIQLMAQEFSQCHYCAKTFKTLEMHIEHITPLSRGGLHVAENVTISCEHCNCSKNNRIVGKEWIPPIEKPEPAAK